MIIGIRVIDDSVPLRRQKYCFENIINVQQVRIMRSVRCYHCLCFKRYLIEEGVEVFPPKPRVQYKKPALINVICQVRFSPILSINEKSPSEFQEAIRKQFPNYEVNVERQQQVEFSNNSNMSAPVITQVGDTNNYHFSSVEEKWHVNLTSAFLSLSTSAYTTWEEFNSKFHFLLEAFIRIYEPSFFNRTGLRYIDAYNRKALNLGDTPWSGLISPCVSGFLGCDHEVNEINVRMSNLQSELVLDDKSSIMRVNALLGNVNDDEETSFIIDTDCYTMERIINLEDVYSKLEYLHGSATNFIRWVVTTKLHDAMEPVDLD